MLKGLIALIIGVTLMGGSVFQTHGGQEFDNSKVPDGSVGARYIPAVEKRIKTRVQRDAGSYDYDLFGRVNFEYFPLQLGNGSYQITIFENIKGSKYRMAKSQVIEAHLKDPLKVYLASVQTVNWSEDMAVIEKAGELAEGLETGREKIDAVYGFVVDNISYDYDKINNIPTTYMPDIDEVFKEGKGICYDFSAVFAAMLRSQGIPCKLVKGYSKNVKGYHAWNEAYLADEDRWIIIDTTYDSVMMRHGKPVTMEKEAQEYTKSKEY